MPEEKYPEKLGKYDIHGVAGKGSMGVVYLGHDPFVDRPVAIKVCKLGDDITPDAQERARKMFVNEARAAGNLDHRNVLRVYDAGEVEGEPYIVMEYVPGGQTLRNHCTPKSLLPMESVVQLVSQCAEALDFAHKRGVTHRDIKPANIMLTKDGTAKIGDFGIAHRTHTEHTQVLGAFGSPRYMSPEQARDEDVTSQSDLFSLGVVLYELLAGRAPFLAKNLPGLIYKILHESPPAIKTLRPDVPSSLEQVIRRALQKEPDKRYKTGRELAVDLAEVYREINRPFEELSDEDKLKALQELKFFEGFSDAEITEVLGAARIEAFSLNEEIIHEGERADSFYVLVSGNAQVLKGDKAIATLSVGDCLGEMGYLAEGERTASVVCKSSVTALKIRASIKEWASFPCQVRLTKAFQNILIDRLAKTSEDLSKHVG